MSRQQISALERLFRADESEPTLEAFGAEILRLSRWLDSIGLTPRQAQETGMTPPPELGLRWTSLDDMVEAQDYTQAYRRERGIATDEPQKNRYAGAPLWR